MDLKPLTPNLIDRINRIYRIYRINRINRIYRIRATPIHSPPARGGVPARAGGVVGGVTREAWSSLILHP
jgi:hypothetical protein